MSIEVCRTDDGRFEAVFSCVPECVKRVDAKGRLIDINPAGLAMIDAASVQDVRGRNLLDLIDPAFHDAFRAAVQEVFNGRAVQLQFEVIGLKGRRLWMDQSAAPLFDPGKPGHVIEMVAVTRDITALRASEAALLRAKVAEEVARSKSLFLSKVGNDLKTPLGQMIGYSELLKEAALDQGRTDDIGDIDRVLEAGSRLSSMLNQLLAVALEDTRRQSGAVAGFDLVEMIDDALASIKPVLNGAATRVAVAIGKEPQAWIGDGARISECLRATVSAASEFAGNGVIEIVVTPHHQGDASQLCLDIRAHGERIGATSLARADATDASLSPELGASALRLARDMARLMGGDLKVSAEPRGARFALRVPARSASSKPSIVDAA